MQKDSKMLSLYEASTMDIAAFNKEAAQYDVLMDASDPPIDRLVKYSIFLSRKDADSSYIPTNAEYTAMALDTAVARTKGTEPLASFYATLTSGPWDAVRDMLEFREKLPKGKYRATLLRFNEDGKVQAVDDIVVAGEGWTKALGLRHGYPVETSSDPCVVENLDDPSFSARYVMCYWSVGYEPSGQQRLVLRSPNWSDGRLLSTDTRQGRSYSNGAVGVLRLR